MTSHELSFTSTQRYIVLIADLVSSRGTDDRFGVQVRLREILAQCNTPHRCLLSPYTITLGDEFQAVFGCADHIFTDAVAILDALYPTVVRFSIGVSTLTTPINTQQAIDMDGPAFHLARNGITTLKKKGGLFAVSGLSGDGQPLVQHTLDLISHEIQNRWDDRYLRVYLDLVASLPSDGSGYGASIVRHMAEKLQMTERGVYRIINVGAIRRIKDLFTDIAEMLDRAVSESLL